MESYSMNVIAQTLSSHAEMIAPGVMGINFMKPEKPINTMSEVYKLVQEEEQNKVRSPTPTSGGQPIFRPSKIPPSVAPKPAAPLSNSVPAPIKTQAPPPAPAPKPVLKPTAPAPEGPSQGPCSDCGRTIVGPFVSLSDRILHQDCFNCSTCGASLQNVGFHNINNKLYCDTHAKLAARVIASNAASAASASPTFAPAAPSPIPQPVQAPLPKPIQDLPRTPLTPQAPVVPPLPQSTIPQTVPTPFGHNLINLPHTPSSSGNLAFRSISPQPFKRISGEYHRVNAPSSPTPGSAPSAPLAYSSGPLPFEMKPYMPPDQPRSSLFSSVSESSSQQSTEISQTTQQQVTQVVQRTTQVTQQQQVSQSSQSSLYQMDYKQVVGGQSKTKFVWPPPKSEFEVEGASQSQQTSAVPPQTYSPLATQSTPQDNQPSFRSVQGPLPSSQQQTPAAEPPAAPPSCNTFSVPPLPSTFSTEPPKIQDVAPPAPMPAPPAPAQIPPAPRPTPAPPAGGQSQNFAPALPPIVDDAKPASSAPLQPGVPTGAGSKPAPKKGRGQLMSEMTPGRIAICGDCGEPIRGPFIIALNRTWCPDHFHCNNLHCKTPLLDVGFVEEQGQLYCEACYEQFLAPVCNKCNVRIKGDCLNALDRQWHPECFICGYCNKPFGNNSFYLEDGLPYCEKDWNELFTTKCISCGFPIEAGDRWVEALNNNYHSQCFKCSVCQKNLEGQSFYAKGGKPFCKQHAR